LTEILKRSHSLNMFLVTNRVIPKHTVARCLDFAIDRVPRGRASREIFPRDQLMKEAANLEWRNLRLSVTSPKLSHLAAVQSIETLFHRIENIICMRVYVPWSLPPLLVTNRFQLTRNYYEDLRIGNLIRQRKAFFKTSLHRKTLPTITIFATVSSSAWTKIIINLEQLWNKYLLIYD